MRLSISNSRKQLCSRPGLQASLTLGLIVVVLSLALEAACRLGVPRVSRIERRVAEERKSVLAAGRPPASGVQVIVLGNSLLETGLRFDEARRLLAPAIDSRRWVVHDTAYYDWYYGLRRLFAEGSRPDVVVLVLTPRQMLATKVRGSYFAYQFMRMADLFAVAKDVGLSNTETSNLAFANLSAYFGLGGEARKWLTGRVLPDFPGLAQLMTAGRNVPPSIEQVGSTCTQRLRSLRQVTAQFGWRFILVIPPTPGSQSAAECAAAQKAGGAGRRSRAGPGGD